MRTQLAVCLTAIAVLSGCAYAQGSIDYTANRELANVRLYSGKPDPTGENLPVVTAQSSGRGNCTEVASEALTQLLAQARAVGGDGVKDVRFRGRWNWMGRVVCRQGPSGRSVQVRGIAYKDLADPE